MTGISRHKFKSFTIKGEINCVAPSSRLIQSIKAMKVVALISGGKDSCFNMMQCVAAGHEVTALANLEPHSRTEIDSYMYQSVGHEAIELIAESMQLPLFRQQTTGTSHHRDINYVPTEADEVEDLFTLLELVKKELNIEAVSVGAILSDYQRLRVENVCVRLGLVPLAYLWQRDQSELLQEMIKCEMDAIIIKVAAMGLEPSRHLGRSLRLVEPHLQAMHEKYGLNVCGEGGEYETLVLDCPLYSSRIVIEESEVILHSNDPFAPVGYLKLNKLKLETKLPQLDLYSRLSSVPLKDSDGYITDQGEEASEFITEEINETDDIEISNEAQNDTDDCQFEQTAVCARSNDGWLWIGGLTGQSENYQDAMKEALEKLMSNLAANNQRLEDLCSVCMFVSDMSNFAEFNKLYVNILNHVNPPSRACVQVPLNKHCPVVIEAVSWSPPTEAMGDTQPSRHTLHVQSTSHWAPANIGPYSQAVRIGELIHLAGQIGLVPGSMQLVKGGIKYQCQLALRHISRILNVMDSNINLRHVVQGVCYVTSIKLIESARKLWEAKTNNAIVNYVVVTGLPKNALIEWHVWAHRHNSTFEYEETGKNIEDWSVAIYRRWNYENNIAAIVSHVSYIKDEVEPLPPEICREALEYVIRKLQLGHEKDVTSIYNLKLFYNIKKQIPITALLDILNELRELVTIVYTLVPVLGLHSEHTYLSVCGVRIQ